MAASTNPGAEMDPNILHRQTRQSKMEQTHAGDDVAVDGARFVEASTAFLEGGTRKMYARAAWQAGDGQRAGESKHARKGRRCADRVRCDVRRARSKAARASLSLLTSIRRKSM